MTVLVELLQSIEVGRELIKSCEESTAYQAQLNKLLRKVKRGELIILDLRKHFSEDEPPPSTPRLKDVVKNYLSILALASELVDNIQKQSSLSRIWQGEEPKKKIYNLLNEVEQAIFELDTEACLMERLAFERDKKKMQLDELKSDGKDNELTVNVEEQNKVEPVGPNEKVQENDKSNINIDQNQQQQQKDSNNKLFQNNLVNQMNNNNNNINNNNNDEIIKPSKETQSSDTNQNANLESITQSTQLTDVKEETSIVNIKNEAILSHDNDNNKTHQNSSNNFKNKVEIQEELMQKMNDMTLNEDSPPNKVINITEEFRGFLATHYIPKTYLTPAIQSKPLNDQQQYFITKKHIIKFPNRDELVEEKGYKSGYKALLKLIIKEITNLHQLQGSPYIVRLFGITESSFLNKDYYNYSLLVETTSKGNLMDYILNEGEKGMNQDQALAFKLNLMEDIAHGFVYLHKTRGFIHRNIKASNILITEAGRAKITGFELATTIAKVDQDPIEDYLDSSEVSSNQNLSFNDKLAWMAPELLNNPRSMPTQSTDIFALGMIFWTLFANRLPYHQANSNALVKHIVEGGREDLSWVPLRYHKLLQRCWETQPLTRPKITEVLELLNEPLHQLLPVQQYHLHPQFLRAPSPSNCFISPPISPNLNTNVATTAQVSYPTPSMPTITLPMMNLNSGYNYNYNTPSYLSMPTIQVPNNPNPSNVGFIVPPNLNYSNSNLGNNMPKMPEVNMNEESKKVPPPLPPRQFNR